jgi:hypothetical protein
MSLPGFLLSALATPAASETMTSRQWLLARNPAVDSLKEFDLVRPPKENYL